MQFQSGGYSDSCEAQLKPIMIIFFKKANMLNEAYWEIMHSRVHADILFWYYICNKGRVNIVSNAFIVQVPNGPPH